MYNNACQIALNYGFEKKSCSKTFINRGTYKFIRKEIPMLPSGLVQTARDQASEMLKAGKFRKLSSKRKLQARYDRRTFKFYPDSATVSLATTAGRLTYKVRVYEYMTGRYSNAQLIIGKNKIFLNIQYELTNTPVYDGKRILGIDRGILNIVACDDNTFVKSKHLRAVKGRYQYLQKTLQSLGTRSARRKLRKVAGREKRFTLDINHRTSKWIVQKPYDVFAVEELHLGRKAHQGRKFNRMLGSWSYGTLLRLIRYKAEGLGKCVLEVDPRYTSQKCSNCDYVQKGNRSGLRFKCLRCDFELNADLNAARNIGRLGRSGLTRLSVNQPIVTPNSGQIQAIKPVVSS